MVLRALDWLPVEGSSHRDWFGVSSSVIHEERFQRWTRMGIFEKLMKKMAQYYARESGAGSAGDGKRWDSKSSAAPLGGEKTGKKNPTDRGKSPERR